MDPLGGEGIVLRDRRALARLAQAEGSREKRRGRRLSI